MNDAERKPRRPSEGSLQGSERFVRAQGRHSGTGAQGDVNRTAFVVGRPRVVRRAGVRSGLSTRAWAGAAPSKRDGELQLFGRAACHLDSALIFRIDRAPV